ncbi:hypothetical protein V5J35_000003 [Endozoicomonas sp. NE40]|uniref:Uncharacterized protein n=1 Tax=Endozoicomonas lisbonensis TaxID=3120522 RepID=A0ABV2SAN2_9GAMM
MHLNCADFSAGYPALAIVAIAKAMTPHAVLSNRLKSHAHDEANNFDWYYIAFCE